MLARSAVELAAIKPHVTITKTFHPRAFLRSPTPVMTDETLPKTSLIQLVSRPDDHAKQLLILEKEGGQVCQHEARKEDETLEPQVGDQRTQQQMLVGKMQYGAICFSFFLLGWNDGSTGPLLPRLQEVYEVCCSVIIQRRLIPNWLYCGRLATLLSRYSLYCLAWYVSCFGSPCKTNSALRDSFAAPWQMFGSQTGWALERYPVPIQPTSIT